MRLKNKGPRRARKKTAYVVRLSPPTLQGAREKQIKKQLLEECSKKKPVVKLEPLLPLVVRQYTKKCGDITDLHVKYEAAIRDIKKENMCLQVKNVYLKLNFSETLGEFLKTDIWMKNLHRFVSFNI